MTEVRVIPKSKFLLHFNLDMKLPIQRIVVPPSPVKCTLFFCFSDFPLSLFLLLPCITPVTSLPGLTSSIVNNPGSSCHPSF